LVSYRSMAAAVDAYGEDGSKLKGGEMSEALAPSDAALFRDPAWGQEAMAAFPAMFAHGRPAQVN
jgi:hypothetical protein